MYTKLNYDSNRLQILKLSYFLRLINIMSLAYELYVFYDLFLIVPTLYFYLFHGLAAIWSILYLIMPSISANMIFKVFANLFSTVYTILGIATAFLYLNAESIEDQDILIWLWSFFTGSTSIVSFTLLVLMNLENIEDQSNQKKIAGVQYQNMVFTPYMNRQWNQPAHLNP